MAVEWTRNLTANAAVVGVGIALNDGTVALDVSPGNRLTYNGVVQLRDALNELIGMMPEPAPESPAPRTWNTFSDAMLTQDGDLPVEVRDTDGDVWVRTIAYSYRFRDFGPFSLPILVEKYGPVTEVIEPAEPPRGWIIGMELSKSDLDALPVGSVVSDRDDDAWTKRESGRWTWRIQEDTPETSNQVMTYSPILLVSLP